MHVHTGKVGLIVCKSGKSVLRRKMVATFQRNDTVMFSMEVEGNATEASLVQYSWLTISIVIHSCAYIYISLWSLDLGMSWKNSRKTFAFFGNTSKFYHFVWSIYMFQYIFELIRLQDWRVYRFYWCKRSIVF